MGRGELKPEVVGGALSTAQSFQSKRAQRVSGGKAPGENRTNGILDVLEHVENSEI